MTPKKIHAMLQADTLMDPGNGRRHRSSSRQGEAMPSGDWREVPRFSNNEKMAWWFWREQAVQALRGLAESRKITRLIYKLEGAALSFVESLPKRTRSKWRSL